MQLKGALIKNCFLCVAISALSVILTLTIAETVLRFTPYRYLLPMRDYYKPDKISGYDISENLPARTHRFSDGEYKIWSNELGCFDRPYRGEKQYILLTGDSFTWGFAPFESKYGALVENYLDYRVLKCGVNSYGTRQELIKIKRIIEEVKYPPSLIIVGYVLGSSGGSDFVNDWLFPETTVDKGYPVAKVKLIDRISWQRRFFPDKEGPNQGRIKSPRDYLPLILEKIKFWLGTHSVIYNMAMTKMSVDRFAAENKKFVPIFYQIENFPYLKKAWQEHLNNLKEIKGLSDKNGAKLLVVLIPEKVQVYDFLRFPEERKYDLGKLNAMLINFFNQEGIEYLDLTLPFCSYANQAQRRFLDSQDDLYWRYDGHWNIKGNKLAALLISQYIIDHKLLKIPAPKNKMAIIEEGLKSFK